MSAQLQQLQKLDFRPTLIKNLESEFNSIAQVNWPVNDIDWDDIIQEINSYAIQYKMNEQIKIDPFEDEIGAMRQFKFLKRKILGKIQLLMEQHTDKELDALRAMVGGMVVQDDDVGGI